MVWAGLGREGWRSVCDPASLFKSAISVLYVFWGVGGIWVESEEYRKYQKALSCGYSQRDCFVGY